MSDHHECEKLLRRLTSALDPLTDEDALGSYEFGRWIAADYCEVDCEAKEMREALDAFYAARAFLASGSEGET